jgi:hypothetical protein
MQKSQPKTLEEVRMRSLEDKKRILMNIYRELQPLLAHAKEVENFIVDRMEELGLEEYKGLRVSSHEVHLTNLSEFGKMYPKLFDMALGKIDEELLVKDLYDTGVSFVVAQKIVKQALQRTAHKTEVTKHVEIKNR